MEIRELKQQKGDSMIEEDKAAAEAMTFGVSFVLLLGGLVLCCIFG